jgi:hypothetical protein
VKKDLFASLHRNKTESLHRIKELYCAFHAHILSIVACVKNPSRPEGDWGYAEHELRQIFFTFAACNPLGPCSTSNSTLSP